MKFSEIVKKLKAGTTATSNLNHDPEIKGMSAIEDATANTLSYIEGGQFADYIDHTPASALILPEDETLQAQADARGIPWLANPYPRLLFARAIDLFYKPFHPSPDIHPTAVIDPSVVIQENVYIGPHVVIYPNVTIGSGVCIYGNVVIYPEVVIRDRAVLHANCTIHERTDIGKDCMIHSSAVIGSEGFGFVPTSQGWYKMQQSGCVVLEEEVEVGANSTIDRPAVGETRVGRYTKLDNGVHIGHGCTIGENCAFAGHVALAGGVKVGNYVLLGGQTGVTNQVVIGDRARATAQSGITRDVKPGEVVSGSPAVANQIYLRSSAIYKRLPEMYRTFKRLVKQ
ncbi:UDP-3-O-(3-hydroxymyristoyl) glucosamine N-acyltransferase [Halothece sp. PCC 7418]|uniref:UDP-3-O-(3-hydroxymyristoyl)glucosamine N-acyltransferase n=1 Tax=Halothece sp. (strain PCC 7418) TaxID=65093 RepID=UPI0002A061FB|nr:UDP-3-O-(3-hydroxymyristoyl)glucosamine N-acyltransferase [Halothece sp. PCC 7418]AFZ42357.1 UDP-3-O-(3-hydroxymyristoyl) glucosamine N-acyltransferase [Halothece sp. PCC 7418]